MIRLFITRHGEALSNENKISASISEKYCGGLTEEGKEQAEELVPLLSENDYDVIIISPLIRSMQTIFPFLRTFTRPPKLIISDLILERDLGDLKGKKMKEVSEYRNRVSNGDLVSWKPPKGESLLDLKKRATNFISYLRENFEGKTILVVGHSVFMRTLDIILTKGQINKFYSYDEPKHGEIKMYEIK